MASRAAVVVDGVVVNVIVAEPGFEIGDGSTCVQSDTANIGDTYADGVFTPAPPPQG